MYYTFSCCHIYFKDIVHRSGRTCVRFHSISNALSRYLNWCLAFKNHQVHKVRLFLSLSLSCSENQRLLDDNAFSRELNTDMHVGHAWLALGGWATATKLPHCHHVPAVLTPSIQPAFLSTSNIYNASGTQSAIRMQLQLHIQRWKVHSALLHLVNTDMA
jgi:hypothetical protein